MKPWFTDYGILVEQSRVPFPQGSRLWAGSEREKKIPSPERVNPARVPNGIRASFFGSRAKRASHERASPGLRAKRARLERSQEKKMSI